MIYEKIKLPVLSDVDYVIKNFSDKFTDLYAENGEILKINTKDKDLMLWLESKGYTGK